MNVLNLYKAHLEGLDKMPIAELNKTLERIVEIINKHDKSIFELKQTPIISEHLKNAILNDFDNLFRRVNALEEVAAKNARVNEDGRVSALEKTIEELNKRLNAAYEQNTKLNQHLDASKKSNLALANEGLDLADKVKELEDKIVRISAEAERFYTDKKDWQAEALHSRDVRSELGKRIKELIVDRDMLRTERDTLSEKYDHVVEAFNGLQAQHKDVLKTFYEKKYTL
jgi:chromosome segregation ATPase